METFGIPLLTVMWASDLILSSVIRDSDAMRS
jgi:hypothetical protein